MFRRILKFNPNHDPRDGRFTSGAGGKGGVHRDSIKGLYSRISAPDGGFTYSAYRDSEPTKGYALSIYPDRSFAKAAKDLTPKDLTDYVIKNRDLLMQPDNYLGGWHDPASGKVFLDVSMVTTDRGKAERLARKHDQIAYFDLESFESVTVNPNATSGGAALP